MWSASPRDARPRVHHLGAPDAGRDRHARREPLADAEEIRHDAFVLAREPARRCDRSRCRPRRRSAASPPRRRARAARRGSPSGGMRSPPRPWIGSTSTAPIGTRGTRAAARRTSSASPKRAKTVAPASRAANGARKSRAVGRVERAERETVVGALERDDARAAGRELRGLERDLDRVASPRSRAPRAPRRRPESGARAPRAARPSTADGCTSPIPCSSALGLLRHRARRRAGARARRSRRRRPRRGRRSGCRRRPRRSRRARAPRRSARARGR